MPVEATAHASLLADLAKTPKEIPFSYLYDEKGSDLYEDITALEEYYPYKEEERLLKQNVDDILRQIPENSVVVELGCGTARKTAQLLNALVARDGRWRILSHFVAPTVVGAPHKGGVGIMVVAAVVLRASMSLEVSWKKRG